MEGAEARMSDAGRGIGPSAAWSSSQRTDSLGNGFAGFSDFIAELEGGAGAIPSRGSIAGLQQRPSEARRKDADAGADTDMQQEQGHGQEQPVYRGTYAGAGYGRGGGAGSIGGQTKPGSAIWF